MAFTQWKKEGTAPRLYITPNTPGSAYLYLLKTGEPRLRSSMPAEINAITVQLSVAGVNMNTSYISFDAFLNAIEGAGHQVNRLPGRPQRAAPAAARTKEDFANTTSPIDIAAQTLSYSLRSIKFIKGTSDFMLTVDTREPESLIEHFSHGSIKTQLGALSVGDIRITSKSTSDELIIERKTVSDLYSSIVANTAHRQAECLFEYQAQKAQEGSRVMVVWLIEGELDGRRMLYNAFPGTNQTDGVINLFSAILGQHILQCYNMHHLAYMTTKLVQGFFEQSLYYKVNAAERKSRTPNEHRTALLGAGAGQYHGIRTHDKNPLMQALMSIPSLKEPVVKQIMAKGHRLKDVLGYSHEDWLAYDGIGKILAAKLVDEISQL